MSALVEEAVTVGDIVRLFTFRQGNANLVEMTLPDDSPYVGKPVGLIPWPENTSLVTILRDGQVYTPTGEQPIESGDELLFVSSPEGEEELQDLLAPSHRRVSSGGLGLRLDRGVVAGEQPGHAGQGRDLQRPAHRDLADARGRPPSGSASSAALPAR